MYSAPGVVLTTPKAEYSKGMTRTQIIEAGTPVRYRTVGCGIVQSHDCPAGYCRSEDQTPRPGDQTSHCYRVLFETGKYRGTVRQVWLWESDVAS